MEDIERSGVPADEAIDRLVKEQGGRLYRMGLRICGNPSDAEDLVQETFLNAYRSWDQYRGEAAATTWLYTIASRVCQRKKRLRAGEPRTMESLSPPDVGGERFVLEVPADDESPFEAQRRDETRRAVENAITTIPLDFRMPLVMKEIAELPLATIAEILEVKQATIKTRLHRARLMVRQALTERLPRRPVANGAQTVCLDLIHAKQEALDRGVDFPVPEEMMSERCRSLFDTLDLTRDVCRRIGAEALPQDVRKRLLDALRSRR